MIVEGEGTVIGAGMVEVEAGELGGGRDLLGHNGSAGKEEPKVGGGVEAAFILALDRVKQIISLSIISSS